VNPAERKLTRKRNTTSGMPTGDISVADASTIASIPLLTVSRNGSVRHETPLVLSGFIDGQKGIKHNDGHVCHLRKIPL